MMSDERALLRIILYARTEASIQGHSSLCDQLEAAALELWTTLRKKGPQWFDASIDEEIELLLPAKEQVRAQSDRK
jgi:hypothetical protein